MKKESTKDKLLKAAAQLFSQSSFSDLTTREIASKAKVNLSAIKYYFSTKENLFIETLNMLLVEIRNENVENLNFEDSISQKEAINRFKNFIRNFTELMSLPRSVHPCKMMLREFLALNRKNKKMCETMVSIITEEFVRPFEEKVVKLLSLVAPEFSKKEYAMVFQLICAMCTHCLLSGEYIKRMYGIDYTKSEELNKFSDYVANFSLKGLGVTV
ncbi:MAG: TetR/AcrR family transcriptional regulator [Bdellovibrionota bacterium]